MADKQKLEDLLREIQSLKGDKYIGTQEAWRYLKRVTALHDNPIRIALAINHRLRQKRGPQLHYEATPERVVGLGETFGYLHKITENLPSLEST